METDADDEGHKAMLEFWNNKSKDRISKASLFMYLALIARRHPRYKTGPCAVLVTSSETLLGVSWTSVLDDVDAVQGLLVRVGRASAGCTLYMTDLPQSADTVKMIAQSATSKVVVLYKPEWQRKNHEKVLRMFDRFTRSSPMTFSWFLPDLLHMWDSEHFVTPKKVVPKPPHKSPPSRKVSGDRGTPDPETHLLAVKEVVSIIFKKVPDMKKQFKFSGDRIKRGEVAEGASFPTDEDIIEDGTELDAMDKADTVFFAMASAASMRSEDNKTGVGCVIVSTDRTAVLSVGWNGFSPRTTALDQPRDKADGRGPDSKYDYVLHAEQNALLFRVGSVSDLRGAIAFTSVFPCDECLPLLVEAKLSRVITVPYSMKKEDSPLQYFKHVPDVLAKGLMDLRVVGLK